MCAVLVAPPNQANAPAPLPVMTESDFQKFDIPAPTIHRLPGDDWGISYRKTAFWVEPTVHYINTTLLDYPVTVKAVPVKYHWNFRDGKVLHTTRTGTKPKKIEDATLFHVYKQRGWVSVNLTTTYTGMYKVADGPWQSIPGSAEVSSPPADLRIYAFHKYLVNHTCEEDPTGPDCPAEDS